MFQLLNRAVRRLVPKLILIVGTIFLISLSIWGYFNINYLRGELMDKIIAGSARLGNTILLGTHYAMMLNSRDDIQQIINNIARQHEINNIRIYNKEGQIKFSNKTEEIDQATNIKNEACYICHRSEPPLVKVGLKERIRIFEGSDGTRLLGIISPVYNEPGCATDSCHVHPENKKILGALDLVVSLEETDREIDQYEKIFIVTMAVFFLLISTFISVFLYRFVNIPIKRLIAGTREIAHGDYNTRVQVTQSDEMHQLAEAINKMGQEIGIKQVELNQQKDEYQTLFEQVPCIISVQDKSFRLIGYNREFSDKFQPKYGDFCYRVYKGREEKCEICPVEATFEDGQSHYSEESGVNKDGTVRHWIVRTTPIRNSEGEVVAAMEMNLDITERKQLEEQLERSEQNYHEIFNNIPNPVFVLESEELNILDCNVSATRLYGYSREEMLNLSFSRLFDEEGAEAMVERLIQSPVLHRVRHRDRTGKIIYVNLRVSPSEYHGKQVLLVTASDITKHLEAEQQLIQASKMATLGEMSTGVAHELNQPLSVIKTASNFFMRKIRKKEPIKDEILSTMAEEIDSHVERATRIINHMRQFGRKSELTLERVEINTVLRSAFEIFSQQLKVRGIAVEWQIDENLPEVMGDAGRLEQVFINLLINARDAIAENDRQHPVGAGMKRITITTRKEADKVVVSVCDSGIGIPEGLRNRVFEPFFTTKKVGKGTGLGLSISYGIIKECGGKIVAEENADGGACFIIHFPIPDEVQ